MAKNNNKGFSLVEIIVAIAVFAILVIPLTTQLISAIGVNKRSTKKQYAIEKAEGIMENFKVCTFPQNTGDVLVIDGYEFTKTATTPSTLTLSTGDTVSYISDTYTCSDISIGTNYEKYNCEVTVSGLAYAVSALGYVYDSETRDVKLDPSGNPVTTATASGTVRALDNKQFAIITGATYTGPTGVNDNNLDLQAYWYFQDVKVDLIKNNDVAYSQYLSGSDYFKNDQFQKYTRIKVSKDVVANEYVVECIVRYEDETKSGLLSGYNNSATGLNVYYPDTTYGIGSGIVYQQSFEDLPPIYLLYMPATCNRIYCKNDYIEVDTSGLSNEEADIYLFESTADISPNYEDLIVDYFSSSSVGYNINSVSDLVFKNPNNSLRQSSVNVFVNWIAGDASATNIYANFNAASGSTAMVKGLTDDINSDIYYYDIHVTLTSSVNEKTEVSGTRGR